jgi:hypothetical protein
MTEEEWRAGENPEPMLAYLGRCRRYRVSTRKLRLFACRCVRRVRDALTYQESEDAIVLAERFADDEATGVDMSRARRGARRAVNASRQNGPRSHRAALAAWCLCRLPQGRRDTVRFALRMAQEAAHFARRAAELKPNQVQPEAQAQADLLREVVGNPYRRPPVDPAWLTWGGGTVAQMARAIYEGRRYSELPVLADALEEAGCNDADVLGHLRGGGPHARGCWVLDRLLDRE